MGKIKIKIDHINDNKKNTTHSINKSMGKNKPKPKSITKSGSKNLKKDQPTPKKRGRRPEKILEDLTEFDKLDPNISNSNSKAKTGSKSGAKSGANSNAKSGAKSNSKSGAKSNSKTKPDVESDDMSDSKPDSENDDNPNQNEISSVVCRLNFDPTKLAKYHKLKKKENKNTHFLTIDDDCNDESEQMFKNDIPHDDTCLKCIKNEKIIVALKNKLDKIATDENSDKIINKTYKTDINLISQSSGKKISIKKTNIKCFWDTCAFTCLPSFLVELFHGDTYYVIGCFCSTNCALAYNLYYLRDSKMHQRKALTIKLHKEMNGIATNDLPLDVGEAGPKELLIDYGGKYTIDAYRKTFCANKEYVTYVPPIKSISNIIEERNTVNLAPDPNKKKYVLKRSKPLAKKKSIMSSMNIVYEEED